MLTLCSYYVLTCVIAIVVTTLGLKQMKNLVTILVMVIVLLPVVGTLPEVSMEQEGKGKIYT